MIDTITLARAWLLRTSPFRNRHLARAAASMSASDAVDGSPTGTRVP
jgi:hypothetical protein